MTGRYVGNIFTLDDWFRLETMDDSLQPTIDMLLNIAVFLWFGAVCPWPALANTPNLPLERLLALGALIILLRRPPVVLALHRWIPRIECLREGLFAGYFGPIGVSAIFYLLITIEFLKDMDSDPRLPEAGRIQVQQLIATVRPVVWMCVVSSVVVHGITIPFIMVRICPFYCHHYTPMSR
jgi:NhaP-type Na+/H+ or K+/H+ antiporter